jgi:hypothetical protein
MNGKYTKVKKTTPTDEKINANEIRITSTGKTRSYISYATVFSNCSNFRIFYKKIRTTK